MDDCAGCVLCIKSVLDFCMVLSSLAAGLRLADPVDNLDTEQE